MSAGKASPCERKESQQPSTTQELLPDPSTWPLCGRRGPQPKAPAYSSLDRPRDSLAFRLSLPTCYNAQTYLTHSSHILTDTHTHTHIPHTLITHTDLHILHTHTSYTHDTLKLHMQTHTLEHPRILSHTHTQSKHIILTAGTSGTIRVWIQRAVKPWQSGEKTKVLEKNCEP